MTGDLGHDALQFSPDDELAGPQRPLATDIRRRRRGWWPGAAAAVLVVVVVVGLASALGGGSTRERSRGSGTGLIGTRWSLVAVTTAGSSWRAPAGNAFSLSFTAAGYTADDSCNATGGQVSYGPGTVHLVAGPMTAMGCLGEDLARMQQAFQQLVGKDLGATVSGSTLTITAGDSLIVLAQARPTPSTPAKTIQQRLTTETWTLQTVDGAPVPGWTLTMTATSFALRSRCVTHEGAVSYEGGVTMQATTTAGSCVAPVASAVVDKSARTVFAGLVDVAFPGDRMTLSKGGSTLTFAPGTSTVASAVAPLPSARGGAIDGTKASLIASTWNLRSLTTATDHWRALPSSTATLRFADTTYQVSNGCEGEGFAVSYDDATATVTFSRGGEGMGMSCSMGRPPAEGSVPPQAFFDALLGQLHVTLDGDAMSLARTGIVLTFSRSSGGTSDSPTPGPSA